MYYDGPINLDALIDLDTLADEGAGHYTFFAFPMSSLDEHGLPSDLEAQQYIAAIQAGGVPVGIWRNSPVRDSAYAAVTKDNIQSLTKIIARLSQFPPAYAADLCERLFRSASSR